MLPAHLRSLLALRQFGGELHYADRDRRIPYPSPRSRVLFVLGDDRLPPTGSLGPEAYDGPRLRRWLAALDGDRGCLGLFAGAPILPAYERVALGSLIMPAGGVIIDCAEETWIAWSRFCFLHAPRAVRFDVIPPGIEGAARAHIRAEGGMPVLLA